jgi:hypothetical protein
VDTRGWCHPTASLMELSFLFRTRHATSEPCVFTSRKSTRQLQLRRTSNRRSPLWSLLVVGVLGGSCWFPLVLRVIPAVSCLCFTCFRRGIVRSLAVRCSFVSVGLLIAFGLGLVFLSVCWAPCVSSPRQNLVCYFDRDCWTNGRTGFLLARRGELS